MAANPILSVTPHILGFLPPTLMTRSTCHAFHDILDHGPAPRKHLTVAADAVSSTSLVLWAVQNGMDPAVAQNSCIRRGDMAALLQLRSTHATELLPWHIQIAAERGHLQLVQWLRERCRHAYKGTELCVAAAKGGQLAVLRWLRQVGCPWDVKTCSEAARNGCLDVLQWAHANGCPWDAYTCSFAVASGHLHILQRARANGCPWNEWTCAQAARKGHLQVLQRARANGCPWNEKTCSYAPGWGHLEVLQWARANGRPWDEQTCSQAALGGHLPILQWARANGCPWDGKTILFAEDSGKQHAVDWARANGCPEPTGSMYGNFYRSSEEYETSDDGSYASDGDEQDFSDEDLSD